VTNLAGVTGYTTLDFALKLDPVPNSISIVRMIEQRARFSGWLNMKVLLHLLLQQSSSFRCRTLALPLDC